MQINDFYAKAPDQAYITTDDRDCEPLDSNVLNTPANYYSDNDGDGFGDPAKRLSATSQPAGYVANNLDCNDYRTQYEDLDGDCWGNSKKIPCGTITRTGACDDNNKLVQTPRTYYRDADGDKFGDPKNTTVICSSITPAGYVTNNTDCDDSNPQIRSCSATTTTGKTTEKGETNLATSSDLALRAVPNPVQHHVLFSYRLAAPARVRLSMHDALGRQVAIVTEGQRPAGLHNTTYNASSLAGGLYMVRLVVDGSGEQRVQTHLLLKKN